MGFVSQPRFNKLVAASLITDDLISSPDQLKTFFSLSDSPYTKSLFCEKEDIEYACYNIGLKFIRDPNSDFYIVEPIPTEEIKTKVFNFDIKELEI
jgi:hypothetical protein